MCGWSLHPARCLLLRQQVGELVAPARRTGSERAQGLGVNEGPSSESLYSAPALGGVSGVGLGNDGEARRCLHSESHVILRMILSSPTCVFSLITTESTSQSVFDGNM